MGLGDGSTVGVARSIATSVTLRCTGFVRGWTDGVLAASVGCAAVGVELTTVDTLGREVTRVREFGTFVGV